jgi:signal transduction histidine kinase
MPDRLRDPIVADWVRLLPAFPAHEESEAARLSRLLHAFLALSACITSLFLVLAWPGLNEQARWLIGSMIAALAGLALLDRAGRTRLAAILYLGGLWLFVTLSMWLFGAFRSPSASAYAVVALGAALLFGARGAALATAAILASGAFIEVADVRGWLPPSAAPGATLTMCVFSANLLSLVGMALYATAELRHVIGGLRSQVRERREAEEKLREAQARRDQLIRQLEAKNAELEGFTYTVSHDLRSPLVTVKGFVAHLAADLRAGDAARAQSDLARIQGAAEKMDRLLQELLELSRVGRVLSPQADVAFDDVVREALFLSQGRLAARNVRVDVASGLPHVWGDRARLVQVLQNLVDNAVKFMGDESEPRITIDQRPGGPGKPPVLYVRDNGIGIPQEQCDAIFTLFRKLDPRSDGSGIGLSLVRRIIEAHDGRVWVESEGSGAGASFCFTLPAGPSR